MGDTGTRTADINFGNRLGSPLDLDIDSDNSGVIDQTPAEDAIEDDPAKPGKHVALNVGDMCPHWHQVGIEFDVDLRHVFVAAEILE